MKTSAWQLWERLRSSFWFVPALMSAGAVALAFGAVALDGAVGQRWLRAQGWAYLGGAEGASAVLGAIAGSMITIAGVVFSLTLVALSLASSQFGPRLLRNFMRDRVNQVVLGTFVATFLYCLLVLLTIRRPDEELFVPHLAVTLGVVLAMASLGILIYFIHHVSVSIQADALIAAVGRELLEVVDRLYPRQIGAAAPHLDDDVHALPPEHEARSVAAPCDGYVQRVDADALLALATQHDLVLRLRCRPGDYLIAGRRMADAWPSGRAGDALADCFVIGEQRTPEQDVVHAVEQLVEIAVRALSPGINDPFTALACIDRLGSALSRLAARPLPSAYRRDERRRLRMIAPPAGFDEVAEAAFAPIRHYGRSSAMVLARLLDTIAHVAADASRPGARAALREQALRIALDARDALPNAADRTAVEERCLRALAAIER